MPDNDTTPHDDPIPGSGTPPKADTPASDATEGGTTPEAGADGEATTDDAATAEAFAQIAELAKKAEERDRLFEQLQRLNAEFQNFRGRTAKEKADERRYAVRDVMRNLLPALDNLERALFDRRDGRPGLADRRRPA
jgi:molecular chaperone GrpE (heat shock protein)